MALLDKTKKPQDDSLSKEELEFLLEKIRTMNFIGEELDLLTRVVIKLQNQYLAENK